MNTPVSEPNIRNILDSWYIKLTNQPQYVLNCMIGDAINWFSLAKLTDAEKQTITTIVNSCSIDEKVALILTAEPIDGDNGLLSFLLACSEKYDFVETTPSLRLIVNNGISNVRKHDTNSIKVNL